MSLAVATVAGLGVAAVEAAARVLTGRPPGPLSAATSAIVLVVVGMTAAGGLAMVARGERPRELLHYLYAVVAFVIIPLGDSFATGSTPRRRAAARLAASLVALGVIARLFATG